MRPRPPLPLQLGCVHESLREIAKSCNLTSELTSLIEWRTRRKLASRGSAQIDARVALLDAALARLARVEPMAARDFETKQALDDARAAKNAATAAVAEAQADLAAAEGRLGRPGVDARIYSARSPKGRFQVGRQTGEVGE